MQSGALTGTPPNERLPSRVKNFAEEAISANPDLFRREGVPIIYAREDCIAHERMHEHERLTSAIHVAEQGRVQETARAVRLESECEAALGNVEQMRSEGLQAMTAAKEEAARNASVTDMIG